MPNGDRNVPWYQAAIVRILIQISAPSMAPFDNAQSGRGDRTTLAATRTGMENDYRDLARSYWDGADDTTCSFIRLYRLERACLLQEFAAIAADVAYAHGPFGLPGPDERVRRRGSACRRDGGRFPTLAVARHAG